MNWPGSGFDPETAIFYTQAANAGVTAAKYEEEEFEPGEARSPVETRPEGSSAALGSGSELRRAWHESAGCGATAASTGWPRRGASGGRRRVAADAVR